MKRKTVIGSAIAAGVLAATVTPVVAAEISNLNGQSCGDQMGVWHFVNNQTGGAAPGTLTATFSGGDVYTVGPSLVNQNTQHFIVEASGALVSASTGSLPGKLVLSDFTCQGENTTTTKKTTTTKATTTTKSTTTTKK